MNRQRIIYLNFIICLFILFVGCSNTITKLNIDKLLQKQKYDISTDSDTKIIYIILYDDKKYQITKTEVKNNGKISMQVPQNMKFVISLHANRTIDYKWEVKNNLDNKTLKLVDKKWISIKSAKDVTPGISLDRQNFYFQPVSSNNQSLIFRYEKEQSPDFFEFTIEIEPI